MYEEMQGNDNIKTDMAFELRRWQLQIRRPDRGARGEVTVMPSPTHLVDNSLSNTYIIVMHATLTTAFAQLLPRTLLKCRHSCNICDDK